MRGLPLYNFPAFEAATADLRARGMQVESPHEVELNDGWDPATDQPLALSDYMERDLPAVCRADAVVVLPGWEKSQGAEIELTVARLLGKPILAYPDLQSVAA
jgi:predicted Rossmann-fold nucleotide-binding protein